MPDDDMLAAAYELDGPEANRALYARWAESYESDFIAKTQYVYHDQVAEVFAGRAASRLGVDDAIIDIGCGTGLAGASLRRLGIATIDGIDISPEMLARARAKEDGDGPVYRALVEADLTRPLDIPTATYAGAVSVGTFTHGHVGPAALEEVVRIIRPGGVAAIGVNAAHFAAEGFGAMFERLAKDHRIGGFELVPVPIYVGADNDDPDQLAHVAVFIIPWGDTGGHGVPRQ